jgi:predicted TIM-barrel fold metal-dependent hydrolase
MSKIIDCHIHCSESKEDALVSYAIANGLKYNLAELFEAMDQSDVEHGLLLSPPMKNGKPLDNKKIVNMCKKSKDRLFPIITVEPSRKQVERSIEVAKTQKSYVKGFKILLGYFPLYPYDKIYKKIYDYAERENLPVMFHTGDTATSAGSLEHAKPLAIDILANERPDLKIVICHFGNPWLQDTGEIMYKHSNVYSDISGLFVTGAKYSRDYMKYLIKAVSDVIYFVGRADKVLFGTDYPIERYTDAINFARSLKLDIIDIDNILSRNAKRVFDV